MLVEFYLADWMRAPPRVEVHVGTSRRTIHPLPAPRPAAWLRTRVVAANARPSPSRRSYKGSDSDGPAALLRDDDGTGGSTPASLFAVSALQSSQIALRCVDVVLFAAGARTRARGGGGGRIAS